MAQLRYYVEVYNSIIYRSACHECCYDYFLLCYLLALDRGMNLCISRTSSLHLLSPVTIKKFWINQKILHAAISDSHLSSLANIQSLQWLINTLVNSSTNLLLFVRNPLVVDWSIKNVPQKIMRYNIVSGSIQCNILLLNYHVFSRRRM